MPLFAFFGGLVGRVFTSVITGITGLLPFIAGYIGATGIQFLLSIGFGIATFTGVDLLINQLFVIAMSAFDGVPSTIIHMLGFLWVDKAFNLILSSGMTLLTMKGLRAGSITRSGFSKPTIDSGV